MNIQDALKENRKVTLPIYDDNYYVSEAGANLRLWNSKEKITIRELYISELLSSDWLPYHEEKEIRPEKPGELWGRHKEHYLVFFDNDKHVCLCIVDEAGDKFTVSEMDNTCEIIHNKNGWKRVFPSVEDESVERIEIGSNDWTNEYEGQKTISKVIILGGKIKLWGIKPPMKMILEIPKKDEKP